MILVNKILSESEEDDLFKPRRVEKRIEDNDNKIPEKFRNLAEKQAKLGRFNSEFYQNERVRYLNGFGAYNELTQILIDITKEIHKVVPSKYPDLKKQALQEFKSMFFTLINEWDLTLTDEDD